MLLTAKQPRSLFRTVRKIALLAATQALFWPELDSYYLC